MVQNLLIRNCRDTAVLVDTGGSQSTVRFANCVFYNNTGELITQFATNNVAQNVK